MTTETEYEAKYFKFIEGIDNSQAKSDHYGTLADHIDCSAMANALEVDGRGPWEMGLATAVMILDCWPDFYPELEIEE